MSAPVIWILLPAVFAVVLFFLRWRTELAASLAAAISLLLAFVASQVPFGQALSIGPFSFRINESLSLLGRNLTLTEAQRPLLVAVFLVVAFWFLGALLVRPGELFPPISLAAVSLLIAALAVQPFLFAALIIEIAILLLIPLLVPPGRLPGRGTFRFLAFQTFGMPFILFVGWMLAGVEASPGDLDLVVRASLLLGLGFAFLLAIFPFHSWVPMLAEENNPYIVAFILFMVSTTVLLFGLGFVNRFAWLRETPSTYAVLGAAGLMMSLIGGIWYGFQTHLGRMLGFAAMAEVGFSLLAISLGDWTGVFLFFALLLQRAVSYFFFALAMAQVSAIASERLDFEAVRGFGLEFVPAAAVLFLSQLSLAGMPLLAGFPYRLALLENLAEQNIVFAAGILVSSSGLLLGALRTFRVLMDTGSQSAKLDLKTLSSLSDSGSFMPWVLFAFVFSILVLLGLFPHALLPLIEPLPAMFDQLAF